MTWNHRITEHKGIYSIREVYYDDDGEPAMWTEPLRLDNGETREEIVGMMVTVLADAIRHPVLNMDELVWPNE